MTEAHQPPRTVVRIESPSLLAPGTFQVTSVQIESDQHDINIADMIQLLQQALAGLGYDADSIKEVFNGE
jgi:hypothetical protein